MIAATLTQYVDGEIVVRELTHQEVYVGFDMARPGSDQTAIAILQRQREGEMRLHSYVARLRQVTPDALHIRLMGHIEEWDWRRIKREIRRSRAGKRVTYRRGRAIGDSAIACA